MMRMRATTAPKAPNGFLLANQIICRQIAPIGRTPRAGSTCDGAAMLTLSCVIPCPRDHGSLFMAWTGRLSVTDPRVQPAVDDIQEQIQDQHRDRYHHDDGLDFGVVPVEYAIDEKLPHSRDHENVLDHHGARQQAAELV